MSNGVVQKHVPKLRVLVPFVGLATRHQVTDILRTKLRNETHAFAGNQHPKDNPAAGGRRLGQPGRRQHDVFEHSQRQHRIAVPRHREVSPFVARQIAKLAGWKE